MAKRISELTSVPSLAAADVVPVIDVSDTPDETKKATIQQFLDLAAGTTVGLYSARPAAGIAGKRFLATDGITEFVDDGVEWRPLVKGVLGKQPPAVSNFTSYLGNGGASIATTFADEAGAISITWNGASPGGEYVRMLVKSAPALGASGYRVTAHFVPILPQGNNVGSFFMGLGWRQSSNGSVQLNEWISSSGGANVLHEIKYTANNTSTTPTFSFSSQTTASTWREMGEFWIRIERLTNGDRNCYASADGKHWRIVPALSTTGNNFITPDQILIQCWNSNDSVGGFQGALVTSYEEESF